MYIATKQRKSILGVFAVLVGALAILVGVIGVLCIGMVYLLHEIEHSELGLLYLAFSLKECMICVYIVCINFANSSPFRVL